MNSAIILIFVFLTNIIHGLEPIKYSAGQVEPTAQVKDKILHYGNQTKSKFKRWIPALQESILDYPELEDVSGTGEAQIIQAAKPFSQSGGPGSVLFYRPGQARPSGAITRTIFSPPSGFLPRMVAAAKAAFATLLGPQTVLSRTTYLRPPRPAITALVPPAVPAPALAPSSTAGQGTSSSDAASGVAAAAAFAAVIRSFYEAAAQRGTDFIDKGNHNLLPYSDFGHGYGNGLVPIPSTLQRQIWSTYYHLPPEPTIRVPQQSWGYQARPNNVDPSWSYLPYGYRNPNPNINTDSYLEPPQNGWYDVYNGVNPQDKWTYGFQGNPRYDNGKPRMVSSSKGDPYTDPWNDKRAQETSRNPGGFSRATADSPPSGDSYADAKVTSNGASAIAAAVWTQGGTRDSSFSYDKKSKFDKSPQMRDLEKNMDAHFEVFERFPTSKKDSSKRYNENQGPARIHSQDDLVESSDRVASTETVEPDTLRCWDGDQCLPPKPTSKRLGVMFPTRKKQVHS